MESNKPIIIGISGKIGSGKDTAAQCIAATLKSNGYQVIRMPFAGKLKSIVEVLSGVSMTGNPESIYTVGDTDYTQEQKNIQVGKFTIGQLLQLVGVGMRDTVDPNIWVESNLLNIASWNKADGFKPVFIVPDVRFPNEFEALRNAGAILIRLDGDPGGVRRNSTRDLNHPSETALDHESRFHYTINTNEVDMTQMGVLLESITKFDVIENFLK